jgi:hypothetical protein
MIKAELPMDKAKLQTTMAENTQLPIRYDLWSVYALFIFAVLAFGGFVC